MKKIIMVLLLLLQMIAVSGCASQNTKEITAESKAFLTITDDAGRKVVLTSPHHDIELIAIAVDFAGLIKVD